MLLPDCTQDYRQKTVGVMFKTIITAIALAGSAAAPAMAADMPVKTPAPKPPFSWTGFYLGAEFGYGSTHATSVLNTATALFPAGFTQSASRYGDFGGIVGGANYQFNWIVLGVEADWQGSSNGNVTTIPSPTIIANQTLATQETDWVGTVTGRLGVAWDRWLIYGKGGAAWRHRESDSIQTFDVSNNLLASSTTSPTNESGYVVGGGVEWAPFDRFSFKLEYDYYNWGTNPSAALTCQFGACGAVGAVTPAGVSSVHADTWEIKAGVNFHFNWLGGSVAAKY